METVIETGTIDCLACQLCRWSVWKFYKEEWPRGCQKGADSDKWVSKERRLCVREETTVNALLSEERQVSIACYVTWCIPPCVCLYLNFVPSSFFHVGTWWGVEWCLSAPSHEPCVCTYYHWRCVLRMNPYCWEIGHFQPFLPWSHYLLVSITWICSS